MIKQTKKTINFNDFNEMHYGLEEFETIKTLGSEAKFILSGVTLRKIQGRRDGVGNQYYDQINRLIVGFPYEIDTKLDHGVIIFKEKIDDQT